MATPFFKIYATGDEKRDVTSFVKSIQFDMSSEKDDVLTLYIDPGVARQFDELGIFRGDTMQCVFGFVGGLRSELRNVRVTDIRYRYAGQVDVQVKCLDTGNAMKKSTSKKVWQAKTTRQIATELGNKYGLQVEMDYEGRTWDSMPQGGLSDWDFLQQLAMEEAEGNYVAYVKGDVLHMKKRGTDRESLYTFRYGDGTSGVISFVPEEKESQRSAAVAVNPVNDQAESSEEVGAGNDVELGNFKYDLNGESLGQDVSFSKNVVEPGEDTESSTNRLKSARKGSAMEGMTAKLTLAGRPDLVPDTVVTMAGVYERHIGNWWVVGCRHTVNTSGLITVLEMKRNANNVRPTDGGTDSTNPNNAPGPDTAGEQSAEVFVYDENGERVLPENGKEYVVN